MDVRKSCYNTQCEEIKKIQERRTYRELVGNQLSLLVLEPWLSGNMKNEFISVHVVYYFSSFNNVAEAGVSISYLCCPTFLDTKLVYEQTTHTSLGYHLCASSTRKL